ncbi:hypothetical protein CLU97_0073 [Chryseobacterium sp. 7]|nr:hypothetical protein CLU97_0073 [Chryseobacterium sp. 7]
MCFNEINKNDKRVKKNDKEHLNPILNTRKIKKRFPQLKNTSLYHMGNIFTNMNTIRYKYIYFV